MCVKNPNNNLIVKSIKKKQKRINKSVEYDTVENSKKDLLFMKKVENSKTHNAAYSASEYNAYQTTISSTQN